MSIGLTPEELKNRNNDSLIKYIGVLQTELRLHYERRFPERDMAIEKELDSRPPDALKSPS